MPAVRVCLEAVRSALDGHGPRIDRLNGSIIAQALRMLCREAVRVAGTSTGRRMLTADVCVCVCVYAVPCQAVVPPSAVPTVADALRICVTLATAMPGACRTPPTNSPAPPCVSPTLSVVW